MQRLANRWTEKGASSAAHGDIILSGLLEFPGTALQIRSEPKSSGSAPVSRRIITDHVCVGGKAAKQPEKKKTSPSV